MCNRPAVTDTDGNGALSFQEFFTMMVLWQEVNLAIR